MPSLKLVRESPIIETARVLQIRGMFDIPASKSSVFTCDAEFDFPDEWSIGLIVGPSGCGKTTTARELFNEDIFTGFDWDDNKSIIDSFGPDLSIKDIAEYLSSVGFSSPPNWLRPFHVLSNGEKFRVEMARIMAEAREIAVIDEFTSVVDRNVARIGSSAVAKAFRRRNQKLVAVSCHYDIAEWLEPDWVFQPATGEFHSGRYLQRPKIELEVCRIDKKAWQLFRKHHYLDTDLSPIAACFGAFWNGEPVAFCGVLYFPHRTAHGYREHRVVCLPDFQGVGIGNALSDYVASLYVCKKPNYRSVTSHPAMIRSRNKSPNWNMIKKPGFNNTGMVGKRINQSIVKKRAANRLVASFKYIGIANPTDAKEFGLI